MLRRTGSLEPGKAIGKQSSLGTARASQLGVVETGKPSTVTALEERFNRLKQGKRSMARDALPEVFGLDLSPFFISRLFEALKIEAEVDFAAFQRLSIVLEGASLLERQRTVFAMFDPAGQGRLSKKEFMKVAAELMIGINKLTSSLVNPSASSAQTVAKPVVQMFTDTVYTVFCVEETKGMDFKEWISFAGTDPEVCRLISALDRRAQLQDTSIRRRFVI